MVLFRWKEKISLKGGVYVRNLESKELYIEARMDVLLLNSKDVITTSGDLLNPDGSEDGGNMGSWTPIEW